MLSRRAARGASARLRLALPLSVVAVLERTTFERARAEGAGPVYAPRGVAQSRAPAAQTRPSRDVAMRLLIRGAPPRRFDTLRLAARPPATLGGPRLAAQSRRGEMKGLVWGLFSERAQCRRFTSDLRRRITCTCAVSLSLLLEQTPSPTLFSPPSARQGAGPRAELGPAPPAASRSNVGWQRRGSGGATQCRVTAASARPARDLRDSPRRVDGSSAFRACAFERRLSQPRDNAQREREAEPRIGAAPQNTVTNAAASATPITPSNIQCCLPSSRPCKWRRSGPWRSGDSRWERRA